MARAYSGSAGNIIHVHGKGTPTRRCTSPRAHISFNK